MYRDDWRRLLREGRVESFSSEYFNRHKGTEYRVEVRDIAGDKVVTAMVVSYPDACPSEPNRSFHVEALEEVQAILMKNPDLSLYGLVEVPEQKYRDILMQSTLIPTCPHCGRVWD